MKRFRTLCITLILTSFFLAGCGENIFKNQANSGGEEAQKESAKIALDSGDYVQAIKILEKLCGTSTDPSLLTCDKETKVNLASAYIADATGIDILKLIAAASNNTSSPKAKVLYITSGTESDNFKTISELIDTAKITACITELNQASTCAMKDELTLAIDILDSLLVDNPDTTTLSSLDKNLYLQLGISSAVDLVVSVGVVSGGFCTDFLPKTIPPTETSAITSNITDINRDLGTIKKGLENSGILTNFPDVDISNVINQIKGQLDTNSDGTIDFSELKAYITNLIGTSPHCS